MSTKHNAPVYSFGTSEREKFHRTYYSKETAKLMTGRDTADATVLDTNQASSLGRMVDSKKPSLPAWRIGTSPRSVRSSACPYAVCSEAVFMLYVHPLSGKC